MSSPIQIGAPVPAFLGLDSNSNPISSQSLLGKPYVLYFYPKDDTPGCTAEACQFRDTKPQLDQLKMTVIGISPDSTASHDKFKSKYNLNFTLLPDEAHQLCELFDVWGERVVFGERKLGVIRSTFIVDSKGIIRWIEKPVQVEGHVERIITAINTLQIS